MPPIITVENVGKRYRIGQSQAPYSTFLESLVEVVRSPFKKLARNNGPAEFIWAVEDVSFEINPGEVVGLIGRNGAGKSTLLKMLSRITEPTKGRILLYGRVGSLLEVGTGFHAELTGRENIYLNGAILGMARNEIVRKFDEIVSFAEVEKFIDTPVKHYSSGMYLRLAFAVAAHLEPEILIIDEVLAVGDARFQRKCLDKMQDVGKQGRTVLFVSHNMPAITRLCRRTILLDRGDILRLCAVRVCTDQGEVSASMDIRRPVGIEMEYEVLTPGHALMPHLHFHNEEGVYAFVAGDLDPEWRGRPRPTGRYVSTAWLPGNLLSEGTLFVGAAISTMSSLIAHFYERDAVAFQVVDSMDGDSARGDYAGPLPGVVRPMLQWTTRVVSVAGDSPAMVGLQSSQ